MGGIISWIISAIQSIGRRSEVETGEDQNLINHSDGDHNKDVRDPFVSRPTPEPPRSIEKSRKEIQDRLDRDGDESSW